MINLLISIMVPTYQFNLYLWYRSDVWYWCINIIRSYQRCHGNVSGRQETWVSMKSWVNSWKNRAEYIVLCRQNIYSLTKRLYQTTQKDLYQQWIITKYRFRVVLQEEKVLPISTAVTWKKCIYKSTSNKMPWIYQAVHNLIWILMNHNRFENASKALMILQNG